MKGKSIAYNVYKNEGKVFSLCHCFDPVVLKKKKKNSNIPVSESRQFILSNLQWLSRDY